MSLDVGVGDNGVCMHSDWSSCVMCQVCMFMSVSWQSDVVI